MVREYGPRRKVLGEGVKSRGYGHGKGGTVPGGMASSGQTNTCENITFAQLRLQAVIILLTLVCYSGEDFPGLSRHPETYRQVQRTGNVYCGGDAG